MSVNNPARCHLGAAAAACNLYVRRSAINHSKATIILVTVSYPVCCIPACQMGAVKPCEKVVATMHAAACSLTGGPCICAQDVVQRIGSKGPLADFARGLCARLSPQLLSAQHLGELLRMAKGNDAAAGGSDALDPAFLAGVLLLLADSSAAAPSLFAGFVPAVPAPFRLIGCATVLVWLHNRFTMASQ